jgi:hypothetical protein
MNNFQHQMLGSNNSLQIKKPDSKNDKRNVKAVPQILPGQQPYNCTQ